MQIPGFVQSAAAAGLIVFLMALIEYFQADVHLASAPALVFALSALLKAIETWKPTEATRSIQQPRSGLKRFLLG
jgi:hypothetical protein